MATLTEGARTAEFLQTEANGYRSRDVYAIDTTSGGINAAVDAGTVVAYVSDEIVLWDGDDTAGAEDAIGIVYSNVEADYDGDVVLVTRDAEVKRDKLTADGTDAELDAALLALGIIVRD
jgi:flagellar hook assembly protein FlgD